MSRTELNPQRDVLAILADDWAPAPGVDAARQIEERLAAAPSALERAASLAAWKRIWQKMRGERRGGDRKSPTFKDRRAGLDQKSENWTFDICQKLRLARSTVLADAALAEKIGAADIARLIESPIANDGNALRSFAAMPAPTRDKIVGLMRAGRDWGRLLNDAKLKPERGSEDAALDRLTDAWADAPARVRRRFLVQIGLPTSAIDSALRNNAGARA